MLPMKRFIVISVALLVVFSAAVTGCDTEDYQPPDSETGAESEYPYPGGLSSTLVPNLELDLYAYVHEDSPITIPAEIAGATGDIEAESLAIWGVLVGEDLAYGMGIAL